MAFLVGAFGQICKSFSEKKLSTIALGQSGNAPLHSFVSDNIILFAANKLHEPESNRVMSLDNRGMLVGKIFDNKLHKPVQFTDSITEALIANPQLLYKNFWGRYVGVLYDKNLQRITLLRDPLGLSTIFYIIKPDGIIFSTEISLLYDLLPEKPSLNFHYFAEHIINENHALPTTPFEEIRELQPGMGLTINLDGTLWQNHLWDIKSLNCSFIPDKDAFEEELITLLRSCTKAWIDNDDDSGACIELSGGLDSSSITILSRDILPAKKLIAVNYIDSKISSSNELNHAQEIADSCDTPLHFIDQQSGSLLDPLPSSWRPNRPSTFLIFYNMTQQLQELALRHNCPTILSGQGGDHVFLAPAPQKALADLWLERGLRDFHVTMNQLTDCYRMPWWSLLLTTMRTVLNYYCNIPSKKIEETPFLDPIYAQKLKKNNFYLRQDLNRFYPAKADQIEGLYHAVAYAGRSHRLPSNTISYPLLSQPLVELALRIPTYQSFDKGYDRIFLRKAITRIKKTDATWRPVKGQTTGSMLNAWIRQSYEAEDLILQGQLIKSGLINKQWLQDQIRRVRHGQIDNLWPVIQILVSERWINQWQL